jgi:hypothetical protein
MPWADICKRAVKVEIVRDDPDNSYIRLTLDNGDEVFIDDSPADECTEGTLTYGRGGAG